MIRVGLIGLGEVAQVMHLPLLADDPRFAIAAVSDLSPSLTGALGARYGAPLRTTEAADLLAADLDAVFLLTPDHLHAPLLRQALATGRHVFVEKPACLTAAELRALPDPGPGQVAFVGYMRRYARAFAALKARLPDPASIRHVRIRDLICESPVYVGQTRHTLRATDLPPGMADAGAAEAERLVRSVVGADAPADLVRAYRTLTGLGSHSLSAMRDLLGVPRGVAAAEQRGGTTVSALYDYGHFLCSYEAVITDVPLFDAGIDVLTDTHRYALSTDTPYIRNLPTRLTITSSGPEGARTEVLGPWYEDAFRVELDAFHAAVADGAPVRTTLRDSLADLDLIAQTARAFHR